MPVELFLINGFQHTSMRKTTKRLKHLFSENRLKELRLFRWRRGVSGGSHQCKQIPAREADCFQWVPMKRQEAIDANEINSIPLKHQYLFVFLFAYLLVLL